MENEEEAVSTANESKPQLQFGKGPAYREKKPISAKIFFLCTGGFLLVLAPLIQVSSPEKPIENSNSTIQTPEASQVSSGANVNLETYSASQEKVKVTSQKQKKGASLFGGLEKIDRRNVKNIPPGTLVRAVLLTGGSNGLVKAEIKEPLRIQSETLIPAGAVLIGTGQSTEERLYIRFSQVVYKDGTFEPIQAQAADVDDQIAGLKGSKVGQYALKLGGAIGLNFVSGMAEGLQEKEAVGGLPVNKADAKNALLSGASRASMELANDTMSKLKNRAPIIEVEAGKEILVLFGVD